MKLQLADTIQELQKKRPLFHSEADFQHAFAWEIHVHHPGAAIRLETNQGIDGQREYIDIIVKHEGITSAIELKYKTRKLDVDQNGEAFHLLNQGAQDVGRYDFVKDIVRLERFVTRHPDAIGYAMLLTNDENYWKESNRLATADMMFRVHERRVLNGDLRWGDGTGPGTMKGRESALSIKGSHAIQWCDYSTVAGSAGSFRYVLLEIQSAAELLP